MQINIKFIFICHFLENLFKTVLDLCAMSVKILVFIIILFFPLKYHNLTVITQINTNLIKFFIFLHQKMMKFLFFLYFNENKARFVTQKKNFNLFFCQICFFQTDFFFIFEKTIFTTNTLGVN